MNMATNIDRYIELETSSELDPAVVKVWYQTVRSLAPKDVISSITKIDDDGNRKSVKLVCIEADGKFLYRSPLLRDLLEKEAKVIVDAFSAEVPDLDFSITMSSQVSIAKNSSDKAIHLKNDKLLSLCRAWAKEQHQMWMKDRQENGWRYGPTLNVVSKTHPMLRPWDELPAKHQKLSLDQPQQMVDLLADHGYAVVSKDDLDALKRTLGLRG
jgi:hypothetical protein